MVRHGTPEVAAHLGISVRATRSRKSCWSSAIASSSFVGDERGRAYGKAAPAGSARAAFCD
ncbi:hypothetical protein [Streptomyces parvus]|uniref:hypothetical protein n=1 Tax=Streptomyces parvus TaxID=66428 RepID=UPI00382AF048